MPFTPSHVPAVIDADYVRVQREFSRRTFGPGLRTEGIIDHMTKEFDEIRSEPEALEEWVDQIILSFDGAWRTGAAPQEIIDAVHAKLTKNMLRKWPDWRTAPEGKAIEHDRSEE